MKKLWLLVALLLCFALPCAAEDNPAEYTSGDYQYVLLEDGTAQITDYTGKAIQLEVPSELDGYRVTSIGYHAFYGCGSLTSITLPDSVTSIEDRAFDYCLYLTSVTLPDSLVTMGNSPFSSCISLLDIQISPDHSMYATIDGALFNKAEKKLICFPSAITAEEYAVPEGTLTIADDAFSYCRTLVSITLPDSITSIGDNAFCSCDNLKNITLPDSVTSIGKYAFIHCNALENIMLPDSVTSIGHSPFYGCFFFEAVYVTLDSYAHQYCLDNDIPFRIINEWSCGECGHINHRNFCTECGAPKPQFKTSCDNCHYLFGVDEMPNFCPECGAKQ